MAFEENPEAGGTGSDPGATPGLGEGGATPSPTSNVNDLSTLLPDVSTDVSDGLQRDENGNLIMNANGTFKKKPGRKPKGATVSTGNVPSPQKVPRTTAEKKAMAVSAEQIAKALINTTVGSLSSAIGPEWQFQSQEEADGMRQAVTAYIEAKGDSAFTPESMLMIVIGGYAMPRFAEENTRSKMKTFFSYLTFWRKP
jgi:hypothetical protein